ncbi:MAG: UvrD-helicase domain-containing protein [Epsilonproteobacteria bacterium]|nr:UvrD-helicase domain-containing protein [Campylobacterota bacterium]
MSFLDELNPAQYQAATHIDGSLLILAGAGSGKTKTITSRLAYLLSLGIDPQSTLTLTFTNKAARQMRERAMSLIDNVAYPPLLSTFHKFGLLFLKLNIHLLGRENTFVIIDTDDKKKILKTLSDASMPTSFIAKEISKFKNNFLNPNAVLSLAKDENSKKLAYIYEKYIDYLNQNNLVDFDDLLLLTYEVLDTFDDVAQEYSRKYQYIMVDEYQDTNDIQLKILKKLCCTHNNICVVGDDDQSIYGFRGANIKNILEFHRDFSAKIVKLEENYRSTPEILTIANKLISFNKNRHQKILKPTLPSGKKVEILENRNEIAEGENIARRVTELIDKGISPNQIAILYRINSLSRAIEDGLRVAGINYKLVGGVKFYEREEIKDIISYLRLIVNKHDDYSFKRIVNKPRRSIGKSTITKLEQYKHDRSFMEILDDDLTFLSKKASTNLKEFRDTIAYLSTLDTVDMVFEFENHIKLSEFYKDEDKVRNLQEFYGVLKDYAKKGLSVEEILNELSLQSDADSIEADAINIMTIHASKGLEFEYLFVVGLEEGFFPLGDADIEEERRLAYVALTRAKKELTLSCAYSRYNRGSRDNSLIKSRFLTEMGLVNDKATYKQTKSTKTNDLVKHKVFGIGKVIGSTKVGSKYKLKINFGGDIREILDDFVEKI